MYLYGVSVALMYYLIVIQQHNPIPFFFSFIELFLFQLNVSLEWFQTKYVCCFFRNFNPLAIEEDSNWFGFLFVFLFAVQSFDPFFGWLFSIPLQFLCCWMKKKVFFGWNSMEFVLRWAYINLYTNFLIPWWLLLRCFQHILWNSPSGIQHVIIIVILRWRILWWNNKRSCLCIESFHLSIIFGFSRRPSYIHHCDDVI